MRESKAYQEILEEGRVEGRAQEQLKTRHDDLIDIVEARFGKREAQSFKTVVKSIANPRQLRHLVKLAASCSKIDELIQAIAK